jgi:hypothetical protein
MARVKGEAGLPTPTPATARAVAYTDADGRATDDPAAAVRGEMVEYDAHGELRRRTRFFLTEEEIPWLPVSEAAFLVWVLVLLILVWAGIGLVLIA